MGDTQRQAAGRHAVVWSQYSGSLSPVGYSRSHCDLFYSYIGMELGHPEPPVIVALSSLVFSRWLRNRLFLKALGQMRQRTSVELVCLSETRLAFDCSSLCHYMRVALIEDRRMQTQSTHPGQSPWTSFPWARCLTGQRVP